MEKFEKMQERVLTKIISPGKGILAMDESNPTIGKRFSAIGLDNTSENRKRYRELLLTTPGLNKYIAGAILFEETFEQKTSFGLTFRELLDKKGILTGIKVDKGLHTPDPLAPHEKITLGRELLLPKMYEYEAQGARFTKWRSVFEITEHAMNEQMFIEKIRDLAFYALCAQAAQLVPIVEPEVLMEGTHDIKKCAEVTSHVLNALFKELSHFKVNLKGIILKTNMITPGKQSGIDCTPEEIAEATINVINQEVPQEVCSINFLSGGQSPVEATMNLNAMNKLHHLKNNQHCYLSYSYGRALQQECLAAWQGKDENIEIAQQKLLERAKLLAGACIGSL